MAKKKRRISMGSDRYQDAYESKDKGGVGGKSWLNFKEKVKFYEPKEGVNRINIIPYEIKTKNHPRVKAGKAKIGDYDYNVDVFIHRNIGPGGVTFICPKKTYGKPCPVCEEAGRFYDNDKKDEGKALLPQRRVAYNVEPIIRGESQGLMIFDVSHYLFEKELIEEAHACLEGSDIVEFAHPDDGAVIKFRGSEETFGKNKYLEFKGFSFEDRDEEIEDETLENAVSLDEALVILSVEEIEKVFFGVPDDDEEDEEEKPKKKKHPVEEEDEDEDEKPKKKKKKDEDPFDDSDIPFDEEEDEKPKKKKDKCPHGYVYGQDTDEYKECKKCQKWEDCMDA